MFAVCVVVYFGGFLAVQHWRHRRGPWEVTFTTRADGTPGVRISGPRLGIDGVDLWFPGTNLAVRPPARSVRFDDPARRHEVPFGSVKFLDTTVLPGTVTLDLFGNEVELLPRTLIVNREERPWRRVDALEIPAR